MAAIVAVLGLSASSQAGLLAEINQLGTNLLTVSNGQSLTGGTAELPTSAPAMIGRINGVQQVQSTGTVSGANAYRTPYIPSVDTNGLTVQAAIPRPPPGPRHHRRPRPLPQRCHRPRTRRRPRRRRRPTARHRPHLPRRTHLGRRPVVLRRRHPQTAPCSPPPSTPPSSSATPRHEKYLGFDGHPSTIYLRAQTDRVNAVDNLLAATANPENPSEVNVSQPSDALVAQAEAKSALNGLFLGLGAVALLVGAVGVANIMIISVLERRSEIGLRRALGATKGHIRTQFLSEAVLLGLLGGVVGVALGAAATAVYAHTKHWATVIPTEAWAGGIAASLIIGALAGLIPALRAARLSPTQALWSV